MPDILFRLERGLECSSACFSCNSTKNTSQYGAYVMYFGRNCRISHYVSTTLLSPFFVKKETNPQTAGKSDSPDG